MSDSFNSPSQMSLDQSQDSTPDPDASTANAQPAIAAFDTTDVDADLDDLEVIGSSQEQVSLDEEVSFEDIADEIEAEIAETTPMSAQPNVDMTDLNGSTEELEESGQQEENFAAAGQIAADADEFDINSPEREGEGEAEPSQAFTAPVEIVDVEVLESQEQEKSYEVHQDGTLTYFQYFLDEEEAGFGQGNDEWRNGANSSPRSFVSATAVGVGVLAATFGAGLLMAEATNRNSLSENNQDNSEAQAKSETERNASEASELAQASSPETTRPDWSATQKSPSISQASGQSETGLGLASALLDSKSQPSTSSVTTKLAPLAQSWGTTVPLPPRTLPTPSIPVITTASLPTPTTAPADLSSLRPVPSFQVIQPTQVAAPATLPNPPAVQTPQESEQQLRARLDALRDRMADPIESNTVPVAADGSLLERPDERWVGNVPQRINVPINRDGTPVGDAFESTQIPSLTDSSYGVPLANPPAVMPPSLASVSTTTPRPIAAAPQSYPLGLSPVVPPQPALSLDAKIVAPVAGLLPSPVVPAQAEPLPPRASAIPSQANQTQARQTQATPSRGLEQAAKAMNPEPPAATDLEWSTLEVTPGAIALEVIPPAPSAPRLTASVTNDLAIAESATATTAAKTSTQQVSNGAALTAQPSPSITSLAELTGIQSPRPLALSRDTAQAALANAPQLEQFRVLPLTVSEYQRLWQESGNDGTFAPVHGFVDYGQSVIAVVVPRGEVTEFGSASDKVGNHLLGGEAADPAVLTEVSAKPAVPAEAVSQS